MKRLLAASSRGGSGLDANMMVARAGTSIFSLDRVYTIRAVLFWTEVFIMDKSCEWVSRAFRFRLQILETYL